MSKLEETRKAGRRTLIAIAIIGLSVYLGFTPLFELVNGGVTGNVIGSSFGAIFVIILMVVFGRNIYLLFLAIGAVEWLTMARIVRGQTISIKEKEFIEASKSLGQSSFLIIIKHIIPNLAGTIIVYITLMVPSVIILESFLSFLGLGVQEPLTSWGVLISEGSREMETAWWLLIFPGLFMVLTLASLNFIGDGLRDALDPKEY